MQDLGEERGGRLVGVHGKGALVPRDGFGTVLIEAGAGGVKLIQFGDGEEADEGFEKGELDEEAREDGVVFEFVDIGVFLGVELV